MVLTFAAGGVTAGAGDWRRPLTWVAVAGVLFVLLSLGRGRLARRNAALRELRGER
jgi:xanthine/uracil/vitamin C permease (AzgA family)